MDSLKRSFSSSRVEEFYSDEVFRPHPLSEEFNLMNSEEVTELGNDISKIGQLDTIDLYEGKILDGRNRYYACKQLGITPRFCNLPEDKDAEEYVYSKNLKRRHLTKAQKAEKALRLVEIEKGKARKRQLSHLKQFKKNKVTDRTIGGLTVTSGKAIDIVAKREKISRNSLYTAQKVKKINDPEINGKWDEAKKGEATIKSVERAIKEKFPSKESETKKKKRKDQSNQETVQKSKEEINHFVNEINKSTLQNFIRRGKRFREINKLNPKPIDGTNIEQCKLCSKATVLAFGYEYNCTDCGRRGNVYISRVLCDDDFLNGDKRLRNPELKRCENSFI